MTDPGKNVLAAIKVLRALGPEIEALKSEIEKLLVETPFPDGLEFSEDDESQTEDVFYVGENWLCDAWHWTFPAHRRGAKSRAKPRPIGELTIAVDLGHAGWFAERAGQPVIFVAWAPAGDSWKDNFDEPDLFPLRSTDSQIIGTKLVAWIYGDEASEVQEEQHLSERAWFYTLPLFAIKNKTDVERLVVQPISQIIATGGPEAVVGLSEALPLYFGSDPRPAVTKNDLD